MVAASDARLLEKIRELRDYDEKDDDRVRYNYKLTDIQAAMGLVQLRKLPELIARRQAVADRYSAALRESPLSLPVSSPDRESIHYRYVVRTERLPELLTAGRESGIAYRRPVFKPLHRYLNMTGYPETESAFLTALSLPIYPSLSETELKTILRHLQSLFDMR